ncbi:MAG: hypothetical protein NTZ83_05885 [Candidatus Pacearchaeota archaeon]|nr:hypothetical protein [Candidatus Pacearchaeota archaeon]
MAKNNNNKRKGNGKRTEEPEAKYEDKVATFKENLNRYTSQFYASLMKSGDYGKQGQVNGLFTSLYGLKEKGGLEGMFDRLKGQALQSIQNGDGLNAKLDLADIIENSAKVFLESYQNLKPQDLKDYLGVLEGVEVPIRGTRTIREISEDKHATEEEKGYAAHLMNMGMNAALYEGNKIAISEQAKEQNAAFMAKYPDAKKK